MRAVYMIVVGLVTFGSEAACGQPSTVAQLVKDCSDAPQHTTKTSGTSFDAGVTFAGQRTYIVHGNYRPQDSAKSQCFELENPNADVDSVQAEIAVSAVYNARSPFSYRLILGAAGIGEHSGRPTVYFTTESANAKITEISYTVLVRGRISPDTTYATISALNGKADKSALDQKADKSEPVLLKSCFIFAEHNEPQGTRYFGPANWSARDCTDHMVKLGFDRVYFECVTLDFANPYRNLDGPIKEGLLVSDKQRVRGGDVHIRGVGPNPNELPEPNACGWKIL